MSAIAYSKFRQTVGEVVDNLIHDGEPVIITRADGKNLVLLTADEWEAVSETAHLLSSEENVNRLRDSVSQAKAGKLVERMID
jgi:antitoxin YefM